MEKFFANLAEIVLLINCVLYLKSFSNYGKAFKLITSYIVIHTIVEFSMRILGLYKIQNLFFSHLYFIGQFVILSFFYITILKDNLLKKIIKIYLIIALITLAVQYCLKPSLFYTFNLFEIFITCFPLIIYSVFYFYQMLNEKKVFYYINTGMIIYLFGSTIIFLSGNIINIYNTKFAKGCWTFNSFLYVFYQILIFIEWKKNYSKTIITDELEF